MSTSFIKHLFVLDLPSVIRCYSFINNVIYCRQLEIEYRKQQFDT